MPTGHKGQKCPADVIGNVVRVMRIAIGEETDDVQDAARAPPPKSLVRRAVRSAPRLDTFPKSSMIMWNRKLSSRASSY